MAVSLERDEAILGDHDARRAAWGGALVAIRSHPRRSDRHQVVNSTSTALPEASTPYWGNIALCIVNPVTLNTSVAAGKRAPENRD